MVHLDQFDHYFFARFKDFLEYKDDALITKRSIFDKGIYSIHVELIATDLAHPLEDPALGISFPLEIFHLRFEL